MAYFKTTWVNGLTPINENNMNKIEDELEVLDNSRSHIGMIVPSTTLDTEEKVIEIYGGEAWQLLQDVFLVGAGNLYGVNDTGGSATSTLSVENLPSHHHSVGAHSHGLNSHTHGAGTLAASSNGAHQHSSAQGYFNLAAGTARQCPSFAAIAGDPWAQKTSSNGAHGHSITGSTGGASGNTANSTAFDSGNTGSGSSFNNLPPYKAVYIWERVA